VLAEFELQAGLQRQEGLWARDLARLKVGGRSQVEWRGRRGFGKPREG
jgi:hypothetical protein